MKILTSDEGIKVVLHGREQLLSLRAKVVAPIKSITNISFKEMFDDWKKWQIRMPGTNAPKLLLAGSYWTEDGWDFIYAKRPIGFIKPKLNNVLVIETDQDRYNRIILSYPEDDASQIISWWKKQVK